jgi:alpha-tubulin suppressor-like RCC1 family protein
MGDGTSTDNLVPNQVSGLANVIDIDMSGGQYASVCARKSDGTVWCWGANYYGLLGEGTTTHRNTPVQISGFNNVAYITSSIYANYYYGGMGNRCAIKTDSTLWCWGYNGYGQVGDGTTTDRYSPVQVSSLGTNVKMVFLGGGQYGDSFAILNDNTVRSWGYNGYGQLGDGTSTDRSSPVNPGLSNVKQVAISGTGSYNTACVLLNDGTVRCMGYSGNGQVGDGTVTERHSPTTVAGLTDVEKIWARGSSTTGYFCALLTDGRLKCWGDNNNGQLGSGDEHDYNSVPLFVKNLNYP